jgi:hypothetical protein
MGHPHLYAVQDLYGVQGVLPVLDAVNGCGHDLDERRRGSAFVSTGGLTADTLA